MYYFLFFILDITGGAIGADLMMPRVLQASRRSSDYGLPQPRNRVYLVLVRKDIASQSILDCVFHLAHDVCPGMVEKKSMGDLFNYALFKKADELTYPVPSKASQRQ